MKRTDRPTVTPSIRNALHDLDLDLVVVAHAGRQRFDLAERVVAVPAVDLLVSTDALPDLLAAR